MAQISNYWHYFCVSIFLGCFEGYPDLRGRFYRTSYWSTASRVNIRLHHISEYVSMDKASMHMCILLTQSRIVQTFECDKCVCRRRKCCGLVTVRSMEARVRSLLWTWVDDRSGISHANVASQLAGVLYKMPGLIGLLLRLEGGPKALVLAVHTIDSTGGPLAASRSILHAMADFLSTSDVLGAHAVALRAAEPASMLCSHMRRLTPLPEPEPRWILQMGRLMQHNLDMQAVHISETAMLLHRLVDQHEARQVCSENGRYAIARIDSPKIALV